MTFVGIGRAATVASIVVLAVITLAIPSCGNVTQVHQTFVNDAVAVVWTGGTSAQHDALTRACGLQAPYDREDTPGVQPSPLGTFYSDYELPNHGLGTGPHAVNAHSVATCLQRSPLVTKVVVLG